MTSAFVTSIVRVTAFERLLVLPPSSTWKLSVRSWAPVVGSLAGASKSVVKVIDRSVCS